MPVDFYAVLGVAKDATQGEIKKAYRKKAMKAHPDKPGGSQAAFQDLQRAYDVLKDARSRAIYDQYGAEASELGAAAENLNMAQMQAVLLGLSDEQRGGIVASICCSSCFLFLMLLLVCLKIDGTITWSWYAVLIPFWIFDLIVCCNVANVLGQNKDVKGGAIILLWSGIFVAQQILLALRLEGTVVCSYLLVFAPWMAAEVNFILRRLVTSSVREHYAAMWGIRSVDGRSWESAVRDPRYWIEGLRSLSYPACRLAFAVCLALKIDSGIKMNGGGKAKSWWVVFAPLWAMFGIQVLCRLLQCCWMPADPGAKKKADGEATPLQDATTEDKQFVPAEERGAWTGSLIWLGLEALVVILVVLSITKAIHVSSLVIILPMLVPACCFCCGMSMVITGTKRPPEGAGGGAPAGAGGGGGETAAAAGGSGGAADKV